MVEPSLRIINASDDPVHTDAMRDLCGPAWPTFMQQSTVLNKYFYVLYRHFPAFQVAMLYDETEDVVAVGNSFPLSYEGDFAGLPEQGLEWALSKSAKDLSEGQNPNLLCALQIVVQPDIRGQGLSGRVLHALKASGRRHGFDFLIAPVRPTLKTNFPRVSMKDYVRRVRDDKLPFDDWLRIHVRMGGKIIKVCSESMRIEATVADWEEWTGSTFAESGEYIIPFAVSPLTIDKARDRGTYLDANVWVLHRL